MKKIRIAVILAIVLLGAAVFCGVASADWQKEGDHLLYYKSGTPLKGLQQKVYSQYYDFTSEGWLIGSGKVYELYFEYSDRYFYPDANGTLRYGWQTAGEKKYYFDPAKGYALADGPQTVGGVLYLFDDEGVLQINQWYKLSYANSQGAALTGYRQIDGKYYLFDDQGIAQTGFKDVGGATHYFEFSNSDGSKCYEIRGWMRRSNNLYYFDPGTGAMCIDSVTIKGQTYTFINPTGVLTVSRKTIVYDPDFIFGVDTDGSLLKEWHTIDGSKYYFDAVNSVKGIPYHAVTGLFKDGILSAKYYFFDENGRMQTNLLTKAGGETYYFGSTGEALGGWQTVGGATYYFDPYKYTAYRDSIREMNKDGVKGLFAFGSDGALRTNELIENSGRYFYAGADGRAISGWKTIDGATYYFDSLIWYAYQDIVDLINVDGVDYCFAFGKDAKMLTSQLVNMRRGEYYYVGPDGRAVSGWVTVGEYLYYFSPEDYEAYVSGSYVILKDGNYQEFTFDSEGRVIEVDGCPYGPAANVTVKGLKYKLSGKDKATFVGAENPDASSVKIPSTIKVNGKKYKVTEIKAEACKGMTSLKKLTIGENVSKIGKNAFNGCVKLKTITISTKKLTSGSVKSGAFKTGYKKGTVKCPKGMKAAYEKLLLKKGLQKTTKFK